VIRADADLPATRAGLYNPAAVARRRLLQDFHVHHLEYYANQTYTLTRITP
jgi:hypothetical protein